MPIERIQIPGRAESPLFSHVVRSGNLVFLSGQIARNEQGELVGQGDFLAQAEQVVANLRAALATVGADFSHVVRVTNYITDARYRDPLREITVKYFGEHRPASTLLVVAALAQPDALLEIDAIAVVE